MGMGGSDKRLIVDCDGVIADKNHGGIYANAGPLQHGIDQVNKLYDMGFEIVLYTARYGDREKGNINRQYERGYLEWVKWLEDHGCLLYTSPSPRDRTRSRMPSSA